MWLQVEPNETPKSSVIRFEYSPETSRCFTDGSSLVLNHATVGSDSSSATPGSSMASVAGNIRLPTISWARAAVSKMSTVAAPDRAVHSERVNRGNSAFVKT